MGKAAVSNTGGSVEVKACAPLLPVLLPLALTVAELQVAPVSVPAAATRTLHMSPLQRSREASAVGAIECGCTSVSSNGELTSAADTPTSVRSMRGERTTTATRGGVKTPLSSALAAMALLAAATTDDESKDATMLGTVTQVAAARLADGTPGVVLAAVARPPVWPRFAECGRTRGGLVGCSQVVEGTCVARRLKSIWARWRAAVCNSSPRAIPAKVRPNVEPALAGRSGAETPFSISQCTQKIYRQVRSRVSAGPLRRSLEAIGGTR